MLLQASFAKAWGRGFSLDNLTLRNYRMLLFEHDMALQSVWNTIWFSGASAALALMATTAAAETSACLITKTDTNPFFVKMKEGASAKAAELGIDLNTLCVSGLLH